MRIIHIHIIFFLCLSFFSSGQTSLNNSGLEDTPQDATTPQGWLACEPGTTPDILPGFWGVKNLPSEGQTYVGLITRADGSFESIGQQLYPSLDKGSCYQFTLDLAKARKYVGYSHPIQLRIWLSKDRCGKDQMIFSSNIIKHRKWKTYEVEFFPEIEARYILFEVFTEEAGLKGHVLIDNISDILNCSKA